MKTQSLLILAALGLLFTACEEEEGTYTKIIYSDDPVTVNVYAGMPAEYGYADSTSDQVARPIEDVKVKIYHTQEDYLLDQNVLTEGLTDSEGRFSFEYDSVGSLWFGTYKDTLSNIRGVSRYATNTIGHNEIIVTDQRSKAFNNYHAVFATLTNLPTKLQLSVFHLGQPVEGAEVQLYFTKQAYEDSLAAQKDLSQLRATYGYPSYDTSDSELSFMKDQTDSFFQTTSKEGVVIFDNLEPRNYWFRITKDTLSNEETTIRTRKALPRDANITTSMTVGIE